ncbi:unnamed protein product [Caretta caretta]
MIYDYCNWLCEREVGKNGTQNEGTEKSFLSLSLKSMSFSFHLRTDVFMKPIPIEGVASILFSCDELIRRDGRKRIINKTHSSFCVIFVKRITYFCGFLSHCFCAE